MKTPVNLLYLEDDEMDQQIFLHMVREQGLPYQLEMVQTLSEARARLAQTSFDVIVADYYLPDGCGTELLDDIQNTPFILLTGSLEEQLALRTLARGADDYLPKDQQQRYLKALPFAVEKSLYRQSLRQTEQRLTRELGERGEQLRLVLDTVQVRVFWKDLNSVYLGCNRTFLRDAGLGSPEEIIGKTDYQMVWREQAELYREDDRRVMETGQSSIMKSRRPGPMADICGCGPARSRSAIMRGESLGCSAPTKISLRRNERRKHCGVARASTAPWRIASPAVL